MQGKLTVDDVVRIIERTLHDYEERGAGQVTNALNLLLVKIETSRHTNRANKA